jgi:hypothetical protein
LSTSKLFWVDLLDLKQFEETENENENETENEVFPQSFLGVYPSFPPPPLL